MENTENSESGNPVGNVAIPPWLKIVGIVLFVIGYLAYTHFFNNGGGAPNDGKTETPVARNDNSSKPSRPSERVSVPSDPWAKNDDGESGKPLAGVKPTVTPPAQKSPESAPSSKRLPTEPPPSSAPTIVEEKAPLRDLSQDERKHGHTLAKHVGRTDEQLIERLRQETDISSASTYTDRAAAEHAVGIAIAKNEAKINAWVKRGGDEKLVIDYYGDPQHPIGRSIRHGEKVSKPCFNSKVVLAMDNRGGGWFVLTSYPEAR